MATDTIIHDSRPTLDPAIERAIEGLDRAAGQCQTCKGTGNYWYRSGPDEGDVDRDPCEDCFEYRMRAFDLQQALAHYRETAPALLASLVDLTNLAPRCDFDCGHVECICIKRAEAVIAQARGEVPQ